MQGKKYWTEIFKVLYEVVILEKVVALFCAPEAKPKEIIQNWSDETHKTIREILKSKDYYRVYFFAKLQPENLITDFVAHENSRVY